MTIRILAAGADQGKWTDEFTGIIAFDRPTYIPWISKQHTFIVVQWTTNWFPGIDGHTVLDIADAQGKLRKYENFPFIAVANWLMDGRLATTNVLFADVDDKVGFFESTNSFRYTTNTLFNINMIWYLGQSGRFTDPLTLSRNQRINEIEARFTYEL